MKTTEKCLLARRRTDGKFLRLFESPHATSFSFVDDAALAKRIYTYDLVNIQTASYYFENSHRARNIWLVDCEMVPYEVTIETVAVPI